MRFHGTLLVLEDFSGNVKAREGDRVRLGGGETTMSGVFTVCGDFELVAPTPTPVSQLPLWTAPPAARWSIRPEGGICDLAHIGGIVARHPESVLGLRGRRKVAPLFWPFGYTARQDQGVIVLVDPHGTVVAREGDRVAMAGGLNVEGETEACGGVWKVDGKE